MMELFCCDKSIIKKAYSIRGSNCIPSTINLNNFNHNFLSRRGPFSYALLVRGCENAARF